MLLLSVTAWIMLQHHMPVRHPQAQDDSQLWLVIVMWYANVNFDLSIDRFGWIMPFAFAAMLLHL